MAPVPFACLGLSSLVLGVLTGVVLYRADYCFAAMFRDLFLFRQGLLLRTLLLLVTVAMVLFEAARLLGLPGRYPFPGLGPPAATVFLGGVLFGLGMVLAGGCVVGTLYRMGSGQPGSWVAFAGLLAGSALYAEIHPAWSNLAAATRLSEAVTLPQLLALPPTIILVPVAGAAAILLRRWQRRGQLVRPTVVRGDLQPRTAAVLLAVLATVSWLLVGMPPGITTAYAKAGSFLQGLVWPGHVAGLEYLQGRPFAVRVPFADAVLHGGAGPQLDVLAVVQFPLVAGIVAGAWLAARRLGEVCRRWRLPLRQALSALAGGVLMGLAARMAPACNVWHLLGGLPILALQSLLFAAGLFPGAWLGSRLLVRLVMKT